MKTQKGFTVIEVMLIVILISILAAIVIPRFSIGAKKAKVQSCEMNRAIINKQVEMFYVAESTWPDLNMFDIKSNVNYFPDGIPTCPVDLTSYYLTGYDTYANTAALIAAGETGNEAAYGEWRKHRVTGHKEGDGTHIFEGMVPQK